MRELESQMRDLAKKTTGVFAFAFILCVSVGSQAAGPSGTWQAESSPPGTKWTVVLRADGLSLYGAVSSCASFAGQIETYDGAVEGQTVTFKCKSLDRKRTITFSGMVSPDGEEIAFVWSKEGPGVASDDALFGTNAPRRFTARRAPDDTNPALGKVIDRMRKAPMVSFDRMLHAHQEPQNWLTYSGTVFGHRYSALTQIAANNVKNLELAWLWQGQSAIQFVATPLVVDGIMYTVVEPEVVALDAATGRVIWKFPYTPAPGDRGGAGIESRPNRGLAILGGMLFIGTIDAHLLAINAYTGRLVWNATVADADDPACHGQICYTITHAPLVVKDQVIVGVGGGEGPIRGFIAAFDVATGKERWRFNTIPSPGEPGNETWSGDSWKTGGAGVWNTGAYDPDLNLTYWGTGNPFPGGERASSRLGDNLYSCSVVALDADTGELKWHYQFTPHDEMDWDAAQVPVLADMDWQGRPRKLMLWADKNGLMYVLDRATGQFLTGRPFVEVNWMDGFEGTGRPRRVAGKVVTADTRIMPGSATNWYPPSYSPHTGLFYIPAWERGSEHGGIVGGPGGYAAIRAFDPKTGEKKWEFKLNDAVFSSGVLATASDLVFAGVSGDPRSALPSPEAIAAGAKRFTRIEPDPSRLVEGNFHALDARTGQLLWQRVLPGPLHGGLMSYAVGSRQFIAVAAGNTLFVFALRQ